jgi:hypothetical protein
MYHKSLTFDDFDKLMTKSIEWRKQWNATPKALLKDRNNLLLHETDAAEVVSYTLQTASSLAS